MRLLFISYVYPPSIGGLERQSHLLARSLVARGHSVRVIAGRTTGSRAREVMDGVEIVRVPRGGGGRWTRMLTFVFGVVVRLFPLTRWADVIQVQQALYPAAAVALVARALGLPVVVRNSSSGPFGAAQLMRRLPFGGLALAAIARSTTIVTLNEEMDGEMRRAGACRVVRIASGVEVVPVTTDDLRSAARRRIGQEGTLALYLGRLDLEKGVDILLRAWDLVQMPARLLIVGDGPERPWLERRAASLARACGTVTFCGSTTDPDPFLRAADLLVLPSRSEGVSNAGLEAMVRGIPVVASDVAGNRELIPDPALGVVVPAGDESALARAIDALIVEPERAKAIASAARDHVLRTRSVDVMVAGYERLYAQLTEARRR